MSFFSRSIALWGQTGQEVISDSQVAIVGQNYNTVNIATLLSILGIGKIYLIDEDYKSNISFLDYSFKDVKHSKFLSSLINKSFGLNSVKPIDINPKFPFVFNIFKSLDTVINTSNDPIIKDNLQNYCNRKNINLFNIGNSFDKIGINTNDTDFNSNSSFILSNLVSGITVEEVRKYIFKKNINKFKNVQVYDSSTNKIISYSNIISNSNILNSYRFAFNKIKKTYNCNILDGKRFLVVGAGSLGNFICNILSRYNPRTISVVDYDMYETENITRQPLAYDGVGKFKAVHLGNKIKSINSNCNVNKLISYVGKRSKSIETKFFDLTAKHGKFKAFVNYLDYNWFEKNKNKFDYVIGCLDSIFPRKYLNDVCTKLNINYIDGGSAVDAARATAYIPKKTACLDCTFGINHQASEFISLEDRIKINRENSNFEREFNQIENREGCRFVQGSITSANQISASLMSIQILEDLISDKPTNQYLYNSNDENRISIENLKPCNC